MLKKVLDNLGLLSSQERDQWLVEQSETRLHDIINAMTPGVKYHTDQGICIRTKDTNKLHIYDYIHGSPTIESYYFYDVGDKYNQKTQMGSSHWSAAYNYKWPEHYNSDNKSLIRHFHVDFTTDMLSVATLREPNDLEKGILAWINLPTPYQSKEESQRISESIYYEPNKDPEEELLHNDPTHLRSSHPRNLWIQYAIDDYIELHPELSGVIQLQYASVDEFKSKIIAYDNDARWTLQRFVQEQSHKFETTLEHEGADSLHAR